MEQVKIPTEVSEKMSHIWLYKMITFFRLIDRECKGEVNKELFAEQVQQRVQESDDDLKNRLPASIFIEKLWKIFFADAEEDGAVSLQRFLVRRCQKVQEERPQQTEAITAVATAVSKTFGSQPDGDLQPEDLRFPLNSYFGLSEYNFKLSFAALDTNCDGRVQTQELVQGFLNFFLSNKCDSGVSAFGVLSPVELQF